MFSFSRVMVASESVIRHQTLQSFADTVVLHLHQHGRINNDHGMERNVETSCKKVDVPLLWQEEQQSPYKYV